MKHLAMSGIAVIVVCFTLYFSATTSAAVGTSTISILVENYVNGAYVPVAGAQVNICPIYIKNIPPVYGCSNNYTNSTGMLTWTEPAGSRWYLVVVAQPTTPGSIFGCVVPGEIIFPAASHTHLWAASLVCPGS